MKVKLLIPNLDPFRGRFRRQVKYSVFPPIALATLAGYLREDDEVVLQDENVERLDFADEPDLVGIKVQTSGARRAYEIADYYRSKGVPVALGGLHVTALPEEAAQHADSIFLGPAEDTWPVFLEHFRAGKPESRYQSTKRTLAGKPPIRRDLIKQNLYIAANSIAASRGCPHACDFCSNSYFFRGGKSFYTMTVEQTLAEIAALPGRHLYFLDDNIFGDKLFAATLFEALRGQGKIWQSAATVAAAFDEELLRKAADAGLRTLVVGFETLSTANLREHNKYHNLKRDYEDAIRRFHDAGIFVNATFIFGLDEDDETVFDRTVEWAVNQGIDTATFHILTPFPGTRLFTEMQSQGRLLTEDWNYYDTAHVVFKPAKMSPETLEAGYWRAYRNFYQWRAIFKSAAVKPQLADQLRHVAYTAAWAKSGLAWNLLSRAGMVGYFTPLLTSVLAGRKKANAKEILPDPVSVSRNVSALQRNQPE